MGKIVGIQYLRALAATMVVVFHMGGKAALPFKGGSAGVDIFVISGFIMCR